MSRTSNKAIRIFAGILLIGPSSAALPALAQTTPPTSGGTSSVLPTGGGAGLLDPSDTVFLLLDHQSGLFQTVKDIPVAELRSNVVMLAKLATLMKIPVITTASEPNGTNGPLMPEIHQFAPHAVYAAAKKNGFKIIQKILKQQRPEAAYFIADGGRRTAILIIDMKDASDLPRIAEPWFLVLNASIEATPAMIAEDLEKATPAIEQAVKTFG